MTLKSAKRSSSLGALLLVCVVSCGGSRASEKLAVAPAATADVTTAPPVAAPAASEPEPALGQHELLLLCGRKPSEPGLPSIEQVAKEVAESDRDVVNKAAELLKATQPRCKDAADKLDNAFEQQTAASRTLCDFYIAQGIGVSGDELIAASDPILTAITAQVRAIASGDAAICARQSAELAQRILSWQGLRGGLCVPTAEQRAVLECGVQAKEAQIQADAKAFCEARTKSTDPNGSISDKVSECVRAKTKGTHPATRSLLADADPNGGARSIPSVGLETSLLRGTAEFFEARAKEEASLFAYDVVTAHLCSDDEDGKKIKKLLKNTCALFDAKETLAASPAAIREAVRADFERLPEVLAREIRNDNLACGTAVAWGFGEEAVEGADVLELLSDPDLVLDKPLVKTECSESIRNEIRSIALQLKQLLDRDRNGVVSLVKNGQFTRAVAVAPGARSLTGHLTEHGQVLKEVMMRVRQLDQANAAWKKDPSAAHRAAVVVAGLRTAEPILLFALKKHGKADASVLNSARLSIELTGEILNREYSAAVVTAAELGAAAGVENGKARNLLGLAAGLAQAESSEDVRVTLEDAAMPLGSWRRKNEPRIGATLTGMVGFQLAREIVVEETDANRDVGSGLSIAPMLLVGADIHGGLGEGFRLGAQLSVLDLGALLSFRTDDPGDVKTNAGDASVDEEPELRVEQVFSPGIYPYVGYGPLDLGVGFSFVPALRSVNGPDGTDPLDVVRLGAFLAIDVSVLPLY